MAISLLQKQLKQVSSTTPPAVKAVSCLSWMKELPPEQRMQMAMALEDNAKDLMALAATLRQGIGA